MSFETQAYDFLRGMTGPPPKLSREDAMIIVTILARVLGIAREELINKLAKAASEQEKIT